MASQRHILEPFALQRRSRAMASRGHIPEQWLHGDTFQSNGFAGTHSRAMGSRGYIPEQLRRRKYTSSLYRVECVLLKTLGANASVDRRYTRTPSLQSRWT